MKIKSYKNTYSYSKLNSYKSCPQKFKIIYIDKIRNQNEGIEAFMGKRVHEVLEWLYLDPEINKKFISFDSIMAKYNELWNDKWHDSIFMAKCKFDKTFYNKKTLYDIGVDCLGNYYRNFNLNGIFNQNVYKIELGFQCTVGSNVFRGFIDRIDIDDKGVIDVIDYKTGKKSKTIYNAKNDFQLAIYYKAVMDLFPDFQKIRLNFYNLREKKKEKMVIQAEYDEKKLNKIIKNINDVVYDINHEEDFIAKESLLCEWCYYWDDCEVKSSKNPAIRL